VLRTPPAARDETGPAAREPHIGHRRALSKRDDEKRRPDVHTKIPCRCRPNAPIFVPLHACVAPAPSGNPGIPFPEPGTHGERRPRVPIRRQTDYVSDERRHGFMSRGAARDGRVRSHSIGHSGGGHRLFAHPPVEKERPRLARVAAHPCLRFANPHQSRKGCGADGLSAQGAFRSWLGRIAETIAKVSGAISSHRLRTVLSAPVKASLSNVPRTTTNQPPFTFRASRMNCLTDRRLPAGRWRCSNSLRTMILAVGRPSCGTARMSRAAPANGRHIA
jgi:hypothetical protein